VWLNGTRTLTQTFNEANQVDGFTYDAAGNLTDDGSATYGYDTLNRLIARDTTAYGYNGDGALVVRGDATTTRYTQDLAAPLSQILQTTAISTTKYLYGLDRLAAQTGSDRTWYVGDALGSVRLTLDDAGAPLGVVNYDPWGTPESGSVPTFGFTGELQDSATGLVNLRARWYSAGQGRFVTRDPFVGYPEQPYSQHPYAYGYSDPVLRTDPSGMCQVTDDDVDCHRYPVNYTDPRHSVVCPIGWSWGGPSQPECLRNSDYANLTTTDGVPIDIGVVVGVSASCGVGIGAFGGIETVFDLYDLEVASFAYGGVGGAIGGTATAYIGLVKGWSSFQGNNGVLNYEEMAGSLGVSLGIGPLSVQGGVTKPNNTGAKLWVGSIGAGVSLGAKFNGPTMQKLLDELGKIPGIPSGGLSNYFSSPHSQQSFHAANKRPTYGDAIEFTKYLAQISTNAPGITALIPILSAVALYNAHAWQDAEILRQRQ
jgi:RHS repeat-associated protein